MCKFTCLDWQFRLQTFNRPKTRNLLIRNKLHFRISTSIQIVGDGLQPQDRQFRFWLATSTPCNPQVFQTNFTVCVLGATRQPVWPQYLQGTCANQAQIFDLLPGMQFSAIILYFWGSVQERVWFKRRGIYCSTIALNFLLRV